MRCDDAKLLLGSYALGGLEPEEATEVERHLAGCERCRLALDRIAGIPKLLDTLEFEPSHATPPPELERGVLATFAAQQPRRTRGSRWSLAGAAALAGAVATVAVLALTGAFSSNRPDETLVTLVSPTGDRHATAHAHLTRTPAGTEVKLDATLPRLHANEIYELWFGGAHGVVSAGTFTVDNHGWAEVRLTTGVRPGSYTRMGITREPDALDPARNGPAVVTGPLPG